ncbi:MAG: sugar ABC transporter permease [Spirochaetaceae bacterium]|nr:sugar ABC transporter permease [Spirochaetaceae bacterium]
MPRRHASIWHTWTGLWLVLPGFLLFLCFNLYPIVYSLYVSLTNTNFYNITDPGNIDSVGLRNYLKLFTWPQFYQAIMLSLLFVVTSVPLKVLVGLLFASMLNSPRVWGKPVLRSLAILPWVMPLVFSCFLWRGIFTFDFGAVNQIFTSLGLPAVNWLYDARNAFIVYITVEVWLAYPFIMTVLLGAMQGVPSELYESAAMDGAGAWRKLTSITLPLIKRPLLFAGILTSIASITVFMVPFLINDAGPGRANDFMMVYGYKEAFQGGRYGYAASFMVIAAMICAVFVVLFLKLSKLTKED